MSSRLSLAALILIVLIAAAFRFWRIDQTPPGQHHDEGFNAYHALRISRGIEYPIFIADEFGEEPMHIYLIAMLFRLTGPTPIGGRIVSAATGVVTVVLLYFLAKELFHRSGNRASTSIGLLASLFLATWYWSFHYNRIGMEPSTVPMVATAAMLYVWRTIRTGRIADAVLAGVFNGLSFYTYGAGRAVPLASLLVIAGFSLFRNNMARGRLIAGIISLATAGLVFLPLGLYYAQHPYWATLRAGQTTAGTILSGEALGQVLYGVYRAALALVLVGDGNWRQNLPGRPMFDLVQFIFLCIGFAVGLRRANRSPHWFLIGWAMLGLLPTVVTELPPHFGRALGATPPLSILVAYGMWKVASFMRRRLPAYPYAPAMLIGIAFSASAGIALNDYFNRWARASELYIAFDVGLRAVGEYADQLPPEDVIYLTPVPNNWYTLVYALEGNRDRLRSFNGRECLVIPETTSSDTHFIVITQPGEDGRSLGRLNLLFPEGDIVWQTNNQELIYALDYVLPAGNAPQVGPTHQVDVQFGDSVRLRGFDISNTLFKPRNRLMVRLWWDALAPMTEDYTVFVHIEGTAKPDQPSRIWAQRDSQPCGASYGTSRWHAGETVVDDYRITLPARIEDGDYRILVGLYNLRDGVRLPVGDADVPYMNNSVWLTSIAIRQQPNR